MFLRVRGQSQRGLPVKIGWHKGFLATLGTAALIGGGMAAGKGLVGKLFGDGDDEQQSYDLPDFQTDKYATGAQETLYPFGQNLLEGDIPDYYKPIGEIGGDLFEDVLGMGRRDIEKSGYESAARLGQRGGNVATGIAGKVGDYTKEARLNDYYRALEGRQYMLGKGSDILSGVRSAGLTNQSQLNQYEVNKGNLALGYAGLNAEVRQAEGQALGEGIGGGIESLANMYSKYQLGKVDAGGYGNSGTSGDFRDISMMQNVPSGDPYASLYQR